MLPLWPHHQHHPAGAAVEALRRHTLPQARWVSYTSLFMRKPICPCVMRGGKNAAWSCNCVCVTFLIGVSDCGKVANDVEVEQIVHEENGATYIHIYTIYIYICLHSGLVFTHSPLLCPRRWWGVLVVRADARVDPHLLEPGVLHDLPQAAHHPQPVHAPNCVQMLYIV